MSGNAARLSLRPERCDGCGRCVSACPVDAIRVSQPFILVDWRACNGCYGCVEACDTGAIERVGSATRGARAATTVLDPSDVPRVVVGSRAEAKAVRKAAAQAAKADPKGAKSAGGPGVTWARRGGAAQSAGAETVTATTGTAGTRGGAGAFGAAAAVADAPGSDAAMPTAAALAPPQVASAREAGGPPPVAAEWDLADIGVVLLVLLVTTIGKNALLALRPVSLMPQIGKAAVRATVLVAFYAVQFGVLAALARRHGHSAMAGFGLRRPARAAGDSGPAEPAAGRVDPARAGEGAKTALVVAGLFVAVEAFSIVYGLAMNAVGWPQPGGLSSNLGDVFGPGPLGIALSIVLVAVAAPLAEELSFRGVVLGGLARRTGMWPALLASAALFAAYHWNLWLLVPSFVLGIALGWVAWTRRSLWPAIWLHVLYNGAAVAAAFLLIR